MSRAEPLTLAASVRGCVGRAGPTVPTVLKPDHVLARPPLALGLDKPQDLCVCGSPGLKSENKSVHLKVYCKN